MEIPNWIEKSILSQLSLHTPSETSDASLLCIWSVEKIDRWVIPTSLGITIPTRVADSTAPILQTTYNSCSDRPYPRDSRAQVPAKSGIGHAEWCSPGSSFNYAHATSEAHPRPFQAPNNPGLAKHWVLPLLQESQLEGIFLLFCFLLIQRKNWRKSWTNQWKRWKTR